MSSRRSSDCQASSFWGSSTTWASSSVRLPQPLRHQLCGDCVTRSVRLNRLATPSIQGKVQGDPVGQADSRSQAGSRAEAGAWSPSRFQRRPEAWAQLCSSHQCDSASGSHEVFRWLQEAGDPGTEERRQAGSQAWSERRQAPCTDPRPQAWWVGQACHLEAGCPSGPAPGGIRRAAVGCSPRSASGCWSSYRNPASREQPVRLQPGNGPVPSSP